MAKGKGKAADNRKAAADKNTAAAAKKAADKKAAAAKKKSELEQPADNSIPTKDIKEFAGAKIVHLKHTEGEHRSL